MIETRRPLHDEVQRALAQQALATEHLFLNAVFACDWSPSTRSCVVCRWHRLELVAPLRGGRDGEGAHETPTW